MSYFPEDIPFMSKEELRENGIRIPKDAADTNVGNNSEIPNSSDTVSRQAAIDAAKDWYEGLICGSVNGLIKRLNALPTVQPEPAIPLSWIEKHIEWHKSLDSEFANLAAAHISVMVKKWRDEQNDRTD